MMALLKQVMTILDAHSKHVQDTHYLFKTPAKDAALAKKLVHAIYGETYLWPEKKSFSQDDLSQMLEQVLSEEDIDIFKVPGRPGKC